MIIADTTLYKKYDALDINNSLVGDSVITTNGVSLPIIATYDPDITENYYVTSSQNENVNIFDGSAIQSYNTGDYDISTVGQSEAFTLSYISSLSKTSFSTVYIYYDQQFYSTDRNKSTGVLLNLNYSELLSGNDLTLHKTASGVDSNFLTTTSSEELNYKSFEFKAKKGYHEDDLIDFYFSWTPTGIDEINNDSGYTFASGENLVAYVFVEVEDN
jgi:hypothetical protein